MSDTYTDSLRTEYGECRDAFRAMSPKGNFKQECLRVLGRTDDDCTTPEQWVWAAGIVVEGLAECLGEEAAAHGYDDDDEPEGPGITEPWEVAYGPRW